MRLLFPFCMLAALGFGAVSAQEPLVFKSGVEQVAVAATVRDSRGRLVMNLTASDFELIDDGQRRPLSNVWAEPGPASVAILMDASGSMSTKMDKAREAAAVLLTALKPGFDEVAAYSFDTALREVHPFTKAFSAGAGAWNGTVAYGATSLWDAIADTAQKISDREKRRAVVVITDGVDSASKMTPADVSGIASSLDVPVYVLVITFALDEEGRDIQTVRGPLADLAAWTGGDALPIRDFETIAAATRRLVSELHHQYVIAFEPGSKPGWHPLIIRTKKSGLFVRARSGYVVR